MHEEGVAYVNFRYEESDNGTLPSLKAYIVTIFPFIGANIVNG